MNQVTPRRSEPHIGVFVQFDEPFRPVAELTIPILAEYCYAHGYNLHVSENPTIKRTIVWDRVLVWLQNLQDFDWIVHVDADVLLTNLNIPLTEFLDRNIVVAECTNDAGKLLFNDGVIMLRRIPVVQAILEQVWNMNHMPGILCAQDGLQWIYDHQKEARPNFSVEKQKRFNSFRYPEYGMSAETKGNWTPGDYVLHLPGCSTQRRVEIINETLPKIIR